MKTTAHADVCVAAGPIAAQAYGDHVTRGQLTILLHGYPSSSAEFEYMLAPLAAAGLRVLALDMPGFGTSPGTIRYWLGIDE